MKLSRFWTRIALAAATVTTVVAGVALPASQASAKTSPDTFYLSWPYEAPPKGNLNDFSSDGLLQGGFGPWSYLLEPTFAYQILSTGKYTGWLADSWGYSTDGSKYTVTLKKNLTWSDGTPLTSKDVVATYQIDRLEGVMGSEYALGVATVTASDDYTIDYNFKPGTKESPLLERSILKGSVVAASVYGKYADAITKVYSSASAGQTDAQIAGSDAMKQPQTDLEAFRPDHVLSSGPYTLALSDVGESQLVMNRTDKTTFGKNAKYAKVVVYRGDTDVTTPLIQSKDLYYSTDYFAPTIEKSFTDKGIKIIRAPTFTGPGILFNFAVYPLNRPEVRQAIAYAVNRTQNDKVSYAQIGVPVKYMANFADENVSKYLTPDQIAKLNTYDYDPDKAASILTGIGFKKGSDGIWVDDKGNPLAFELSYPSDYTDWVPAAQDVASQLTDFGIKITLRGVPDADHRVTVRNGTFQMAIRLWGYPNVLPYYAFKYLYEQNSVGGKATKGTGYTDLNTYVSNDASKTDFGALVSAMAAGTDPAPQKVAVATAALDFNQNLPVVPLVERLYNCPLVTDNISGLPADSDPLWGNVGGSDNAINVLLMNGTIGPVGSATTSAAASGTMSATMSPTMAATAAQ